MLRSKGEEEGAGVEGEDGRLAQCCACQTQRKGSEEGWEGGAEQERIGHPAERNKTVSGPAAAGPCRFGGRNRDERPRGLAVT